MGGYSQYLSTKFCRHLMSLMSKDDYSKTIDMVDAEIADLCTNCDRKKE